jgi:D-tagatose-1,6-bisphosphate aldolase subunit GatZ/KbaZ
VIALVVQPGVEFDHDAVVGYDRAKARTLVAWLRGQPEEIVFEAHSTDYQLPQAYVELVEDGFAILKVGPALTFATRETLGALEDIESQLVSETQPSFSQRHDRGDHAARADELDALLRGQSSRTEDTAAL